VTNPIRKFHGVAKVVELEGCEVDFLLGKEVRPSRSANGALAFVVHIFVDVVIFSVVRKRLKIVTPDVAKGLLCPLIDEKKRPTVGCLPDDCLRRL
jgi:hypothetical protein